LALPREAVGRFNESYPHGLFRVFREVRQQLALSGEDVAREQSVSFAIVNWSENGLSKPSKLARAQLDAFCERMQAAGMLNLPEVGRG
jgi:putative transcriptional regulator